MPSKIPVTAKTLQTTAKCHFAAVLWPARSGSQWARVLMSVGVAPPLPRRTRRRLPPTGPGQCRSQQSFTLRPCAAIHGSYSARSGNVGSRRRLHPEAPRLVPRTLRPDSRLRRDPPTHPCPISGSLRSPEASARTARGESLDDRPGSTIVDRAVNSIHLFQHRSTLAPTPLQVPVYTGPPSASFLSLPPTNTLGNLIHIHQNNCICISPKPPMSPLHQTRTRLATDKKSMSQNKRRFSP